MAKDPRFVPRNVEQERKETPVQGNQIFNNSITKEHIQNGAITTEKIALGAVSIAGIADGSVTNIKLATDSVTADKIAANAVGNSEIADDSISGNKLQALTIIRPIHHSEQMSASLSGWVRVARLQTMSSVDFWVRTTVSGHHNISQFVFSYAFIGYTGGASCQMNANAKFGNGWTDARIVYAGIYDQIFFEIYLPQVASIYVSQISAFGNYYTGYSNIRCEQGSIPGGYTSTTFAGMGGYVPNAWIRTSA